MTGRVVWITGRPSSGKSTFARAAARALRRRGRAVVVLDGDQVRASLVPPPGYSARERDRFYDTLARLAALLAGQGLTVLVPATAHLRRFRARARRLAPVYVEVWVRTPPEVCARRDPKRLYRRARAGLAPTLPGVGVAYEEPRNPQLVAHGGRDLAAMRALTRLCR